MTTSTAPPAQPERARGRRPPNPFALPHRANYLSPLSPLEVSEHADYYVTVDRSQEAFEEFKDILGDPNELRHKGKLVVVHGPSGCGKSSLVNRCAYHLKRFDPPERSLIVINLLQQPDIRGAAGERMRAVCHQLIQWLRPTLDVSPLREYAESPGAFYRELSAQLSDYEVMAAILLPTFGSTVAYRPSDPTERSPRQVTIDELSAYLEMAEPGIIFFAESSQADDIQHWLHGLTPFQRGEAIALAVSTLQRSEEGRRFVRDRLDRMSSREPPDGESPAPRLPLDTVEELMNELSPISVQRLQRLLSEVWDYAVKRQIAEIRYDTIARYYIETSREYPR